MKPSRRLTLTPLRVSAGALRPALGSVFLALCLGAGCGSAQSLGEAVTEPDFTAELVAQTARVPQPTKVDPATAFAGASPLLTITGRN